MFSLDLAQTKAIGNIYESSYYELYSKVLIG